MNFNSNTNSSSSFRSPEHGSRIPFRIDPYLNLYHRLFPGEMKLFEILGMHPLASKPVKNPFDSKAKPAAFANIGEHSLAVSVAARGIAKALLDLELLPRIEFRRILLRGLIHDVFKPFEIMLGEQMNMSETSDKARIELLRLLGENRVPTYLVQEILSAGNETGHKSLASFLEIEPNGEVFLRKGRMPEKIIFLADTLTSTSIPSERTRSETYYVRPSERVYEANARYPFLSNAGLILNDVGEIEEIQDVSNLPSTWKSLGTYGELQEFVAREIAQEFTNLILPGEPCSADEAEELMLRLIALELKERQV